jgi:cell division protein FtsB
MLTFILLIALALLQHKLWFGQGGLLQVWDQVQAMEAQIQENKRLEERNASLQAEVADLKSGLEAVEERARSEMGMVKNGETFYQIVGESLDP